MYATVQELVDALTLEEKAGLCTGAAVPRLGLPALRVNGLHSQESAGGVCFPSACAAAASFDPEVARRMGAALGREARSGGAQLLDVPDVNLKRGPLSGRSADTWGEDPCLTGRWPRRSCKVCRARVWAAARGGWPWSTRRQTAGR
ncbi:hypothetical protein NIA69_03420 [Gemmiger formicilis]|nr:hypothetical protein [Gemmiger formicilis]